MHYEFPIIKHIDDILPHIEGKDEFIVVDKGEYTVINYVYQDSDTFPHGNIYLPECRGLIFCSRTGKILRRPYHKFFNLNEREDTQEEVVDLDRDHYVFDKIDGSMVTPIQIGKYIRWTTKMGITGVAVEAEKFVARNPKYTEFASYCINNGWTPIFEWLDISDPIVLKYNEDNLILTAVRDNTTGEYRSPSTAPAHNIPVNIVTYHERNLKNLINLTKGGEDTEGVVIRFDNGHMVKIKSDWYVQLHKFKSLVSSDRQLIKLILEDKLDDIIGTLPEPTKSEIEAKRDKFLEKFNSFITRGVEPVYRHICVKYPTRKELGLTTGIAPEWKHLYFKMMDGVSAREALTNILLRDCTKLNKFTNLKEALPWLDLNA